MKSAMFSSLHAHLDRVEGVAHAQLSDAGEDARDETAIVLRCRRFSWLALSDGFIAVSLDIRIC